MNKKSPFRMMAACWLAMACPATCLDISNDSGTLPIHPGSLFSGWENFTAFGGGTVPLDAARKANAFAVGHFISPQLYSQTALAQDGPGRVVFALMSSPGGHDFLASVNKCHLDFDKPLYAPDDPEKKALIPQLQCLDLFSFAIEKSQWQVLKARLDWDQVEELVMPFATTVGDDLGVVLPARLRSLALYNTAISPKLLDQLLKLPQLERLFLWGCTLDAECHQRLGLVQRMGRNFATTTGDPVFILPQVSQLSLIQCHSSLEVGFAMFGIPRLDELHVTSDQFLSPFKLTSEPSTASKRSFRELKRVYVYRGDTNLSEFEDGKVKEGLLSLEIGMDCAIHLVRNKRGSREVKSK